MKRVLFLSPSASTHGGFESVLCRLCRHLPAFGWEPVLALARGARFHHPARFLADNGPLPSIELDGTQGTFEARRSAIKSAVRKLEPDVIVGARVFDAIPAVDSLRRQGVRVPLVQMVGSWDTDLFSDLRRYREVVDFCVVDSKLPGRAITGLCGYGADQVRRIPTGIEPMTPSVRTPSGAALRLCYAGRLDDADKRACDLVPLVQELNRRGVNFTLTVAGDGRDRVSIEARLAGEAPGGRVHFRGWLDASQLRAMFFEQDVLLQFSASEGLTISPREGLICGVVPVLSEFKGLFTEGLFRPGTNCLSFPVGDMAAAAEQLTRLHGDRQLLERLSGAGRIAQSEEYLFPNDIRAWAEFLNHAASWPSAAPSPNHLRFPEDTGRLDRLPAIVRRLARKFSRHLHAEPGGEWPHASGWATDDERRAFELFALDLEKRSRCVALQDT